MRNNQIQSHLARIDKIIKGEQLNHRDQTLYEIQDRRDDLNFRYDQMNGNEHKACLVKRMKSYTEASKFLLEFYHPKRSHTDLQNHKAALDTLYRKSLSDKDVEGMLNRHVTTCASYLVDNGFIQGGVFKKNVIAFNDILHAENILNWRRERTTLLTIQHTKVPNVKHFETLTMVQFDIPIIKLTAKQKKHYLTCLDPDKNNRPSWFTKLADWEQNYWVSVIREHNGDIAKVHSIQPPTIRAYPGLANYMLHGIAIYNEQNERLFELTRYRSSIIHPISISDEQTASHIAQLNLQQLVENHANLSGKNDAPVLLAQTLVSALRIPDIKGNEARMRERKKDDVETYGESQAAENLVVIETNYPFNKWQPGSTARGVFSRRENYSAAQHAIIQLVIDYFEDRFLEKGHDRILLRLLESLKALRKSEVLSQKVDCLPPPHLIEQAVLRISKNQNLAKRCGLLVYYCQEYLELHRIDNQQNRTQQARWHGMLKPMLEEMTVSLIDDAICHASCKSGKDRRAMELMLEDSLILYYHLSHKVMISKDSSHEAKRIQAQLFLQLFTSGHHQTLAEYNARGCLGLKSIGTVLPKHIINEISKNKMGEILIHNKRCSEMNRPGFIKYRKVKRKLKSVFERFERDDTVTKESLMTEVKSLLSEDALDEGMLLEEREPVTDPVTDNASRTRVIRVVEECEKAITKNASEPKSEHRTTANTTNSTTMLKELSSSPQVSTSQANVPHAALSSMRGRALRETIRGLTSLKQFNQQGKSILEILYLQKNDLSAITINTIIRRTLSLLTEEVRQVANHQHANSSYAFSTGLRLFEYFLFEGDFQSDAKKLRALIPKSNMTNNAELVAALKRAIQKKSNLGVLEEYLLMLKNYNIQLSTIFNADDLAAIDNLYMPTILKHYDSLDPLQYIVLKSKLKTNNQLDKTLQQAIDDKVTNLELNDKRLIPYVKAVDIMIDDGNASELQQSLQVAEKLSNQDNKLLSIAVSMKKPEYVKVLLERGAAINSLTRPQQLICHMLRKTQAPRNPASAPSPGM